MPGQRRSTTDDEIRQELPPARPTAEDGPDKPTQLSGRSWWGVLKRVVKEYQRDNLSDWAAALTYYAMLSIFPGLLVLVSGLRLVSRSAVNTVIDNLTQVTPGTAKDIVKAAVKNILDSGQNTASILAIVSLVGALWSASGYVAAFMRAANAIYDVPEGRPIWKKLPVRLGVTIVTGVLLSISAFAVVLTGRLAEQAGKLIGLGGGAGTPWDYGQGAVVAASLG